MTPLSKLIVAGLILRLGLAFLYHPDIKSQAFHGQFLRLGVIDIYTYLDKNRSALPYSDTFNYPPLAYLWLGGNVSLASLFTSGEILSWINDWTNPAGANYSIFSFLLLLKLPYLVLDLLLLSLILIVTRKNHTATLFWAFNPINLYSTYAIGQFDLLPAICLAIGLLMYRRRPLISGMMIAIGTGLKSFPILGAAVILLSPATLKNKAKFLIAFVFSLFVVYFPTLFSSGFAASQLNSGLLTRAWELRIMSVPIVPLVIITTILIGLIKKTDAVKLTNSILTLTISFVRPHAQWGVWTHPLMGVLSSKISRFSLFVYISWIVLLFANIFLLPDLYVFVGLFSSFVPQILSSPTFVSQFENIALLSQVGRLLLVLSGLVFVFRIVFTNYTKSIISKNISGLAIIFSLLLVIFIPIFSIVYTVKVINYLPISSIAVDPGSFSPLTFTKPTISEISVPVNGLNQISIYMKNPSVKNTTPLQIDLLDQSNNLVRSLSINGSNVGDGVHLPFRFAKIIDSGGQNYYLRLTTLADDPNPISVSLPKSQLALEIFADPDLNPHLINSLIFSLFSKLNSVQLLFILSVWILVPFAILRSLKNLSGNSS